MTEPTICFVIAQIGKADGEEWKRTDKVLRHVIQPALQECGYKGQLANQINEPGVITRQIIDRLMDAPLVVADLTGYNPNVFYELAIRHATRKPLVQMIQQGHPIPFDVVPVRTIQLNYPDPDGLADGRKQLVDHIRAVEKDPSLVDNPISDAIDLRGLKGSDKPAEVQNARILEALAELRREMVELHGEARRDRIAEANRRIFVESPGSWGPVRLSEVLGPLRAHNLKSAEDDNPAGR